MKMVLGDLTWLTANLDNLDKKTEIVIRVTNGRQVMELPVEEVILDKKITITCSLPLEPVVKHAR